MMPALFYLAAASPEPVPESLASWLKVFLYIVGGIGVVVFTIKQLLPRPPASDLDKSLEALRSKVDSELRRVAEQISSTLKQIGDLTGVVNLREEHAVKRREEFRREFSAIRGEVDAKVSGIYRELNPLAVAQANTSGQLTQIVKSLDALQEQTASILRKLP